MGSSPQYWLNLKQIYELRIAAVQIGDELGRTIEPKATPTNEGAYRSTPVLTLIS
jgi:plasmid maintenance system antidote protein VapI